MMLDYCVYAFFFLIGVIFGMVLAKEIATNIQPRVDKWLDNLLSTEI